MKKLAKLLCFEPGPGRTRASEYARGLQPEFGAKEGALAAVRGSDATRNGRTFGAMGGGAALLCLNRLMNLSPARIVGNLAQARGIAGGAECGARLEN